MGTTQQIESKHGQPVIGSRHVNHLTDYETCLGKSGSAGYQACACFDKVRLTAGLPLTKSDLPPETKNLPTPAKITTRALTQANTLSALLAEAAHHSKVPASTVFALGAPTSRPELSHTQRGGADVWRYAEAAGGACTLTSRQGCGALPHTSHLHHPPSHASRMTLCGVTNHQPT